MKISEAIKALEDIKEVAGDLPLAGCFESWPHPATTVPHSIYLDEAAVDITYAFNDDEAYVTMTHQDF